MNIKPNYHIRVFSVDFGYICHYYLHLLSLYPGHLFLIIICIYLYSSLLFSLIY